MLLLNGASSPLTPPRRFRCIALSRLPQSFKFGYNHSMQVAKQSGIRSLVCSVLLASSSAHSASHMLWILSENKVEKMASSYEFNESTKNSRVILTAGFPKVLKTDSFKGLNPGLYIVLLGACVDSKEATSAASLAVAKDLKSLASRSYKPSYFKSAEYPAAHSCPVHVRTAGRQQEQMLQDKIKESNLSTDSIVSYANFLKD